MNCHNIQITLINNKPFDVKEVCSFKSKKVLDSIRKYGQLKPIIVYQQDEQFVIVSGKTVYNTMLNEGKKDIWVNVIEKPTVLERIDISNLLSESVRDIDILKFANLISDLSQNYTDEQIAEQLNVQLMQVKVLKDLLNLKFTYEARKDNSQPAFNFDEES